jgi:hypothetical protein
MSTWGVASPLALPAVYNPTGDITCTADTAVTAITTGAIKALDNGNYYPLLLVTLAILQGATKPTSLTVKFILGAGTAVDTYTVEPGLLSNNGELVVNCALVGANSASAWSGVGSTINLQVTAAGQAVTCKQVGSRALVALFRGPDA